MQDIFSQYGFINQHLSQRRLALVLIISSVYGLYIGLSRPFPQVAVEQGQVLASIVQYPPNSPFFIYQIKTWSLLGQLSALGLVLGLSESVLSILYVGVAGALTFAGVALWVLALSDSILFALLSPPFFVKLLEGFLWDFNYPINLLGSEHTYGMIGMAFIFFVYGLFAHQQRRWGWVLAGIAIAIHPSLGVWLNIVLWVSLFSDFKNLPFALAEAVTFSLGGYLLSAGSLIYQVVFYHVPVLDQATLHQYMQAYLAYWEDHRQLINLITKFNFNIPMVTLGLFVSSFWLFFKQAETKPPTQFLLRLYIVTVVVGGLAAAILYIPLPLPAPDILWTLMPTRFLNLALIGYAPLVLGLLWRQHKTRWGRAVNFIAITMLATNIFFFFADWFLLIDRKLVLILLYSQLMFYGILSLILIPSWQALAEKFPAFQLFGRLKREAQLINEVTPRTFSSREARPEIPDKISATQIAIFIVFVAAVFWTAPQGDFFKRLRSFTVDFYTHPFRVATAQSQGQIVAPGDSCNITLNQFITHRPILNFMPTNMLAYAIEGAPSMEKILRDIYEVDFFSPSPTASSYSALAPHIKALWEKRTTDEWLALKEKYMVSEVLAPTNWRLLLPYVTTDDRCNLYRISAQ